MNYIYNRFSRFWYFDIAMKSRTLEYIHKHHLIVFDLLIIVFQFFVSPACNKFSILKFKVLFLKLRVFDTQQQYWGRRNWVIQYKRLFNYAERVALNKTIETSSLKQPWSQSSSGYKQRWQGTTNGTRNGRDNSYGTEFYVFVLPNSQSPKLNLFNLL